MHGVPDLMGFYVIRRGLTTGVPIVSPPTGSHFRYGTLSWQPLTSTIIDSGGLKREVEVRSVRSLLILKKVILCKSMSRQEAVNEMRPISHVAQKAIAPNGAQMNRECFLCFQTWASSINVLIHVAAV
jgi:hypothetical protein